MSSEQPEVERLTEEFEKEWAKTWQTDFGKPPEPEELRSHPQYKPVLNAWLEGHGVKPTS